MFSKKVIINIDGMHCDNCAKRVEEKFKKIKGVKSIKVNLNGKNATLKCSNGFSLDQVNSIVEELGFKCTGIDEEK